MNYTNEDINGTNNENSNYDNINNSHEDEYDDDDEEDDDNEENEEDYENILGYDEGDDDDIDNNNDRNVIMDEIYRGFNNVGILNNINMNIENLYGRYNNVIREPEEDFINVNNVFNEIINNGNNVDEENVFNDLFNNNAGNPRVYEGILLLNNGINAHSLLINEYFNYCSEDNMLNFINFDTLNIIHNIFLEFYEQYKQYTIGHSDLIKKTITKSFKILMRTGITERDATLNIMTYVRYSENYINIEDEEYNGNLLYNNYEIVKECVKKNLLAILIARDFQNIINQVNIDQNNLNMEDVRTVLTEETLSNLPIMTYNIMSDELKTINNHCSICRENYNDFEYKNLRLLKCNHVFCQECIDPWLLNHSYKCPNCREEMDGHIHI